jgi:hypothetical protein
MISQQRQLNIQNLMALIDYGSLLLRKEAFTLDVQKAEVNQILNKLVKYLPSSVYQNFFAVKHLFKLLKSLDEEDETI